jgi:hypothetical protein
MTNAAILDFYTQQSEHTSPGHHSLLFRSLPGDVGALCRIVQGLFIYDMTAEPFYGFKPPQSRRDEIHAQTVDEMLARIRELDSASLDQARSPERRMLARCDGFVLMLISMLRAKGVPARARCGFGAYFNPPKFEDHWTCEWWSAEEKRWRLADPQFDSVWRKQLKIAHDISDVPRTAFLVAADAWSRCRSGKVDPAQFGISFVKLKGLWYVAGNLVRDLAALNRHEMRPWDVWGMQPEPKSRLDKAELATFDQLAELTADPDGNFTELQRRFAHDGLRVPDHVFNSLRQKREAA